MHVGTISFCDRIVFNIKSSDTKDAILQDLENRFHIRILQRHWNPLDEQSLVHMARIPHLACLRSNGNPYYLYFTYHEDTPIVYYIDKKVQPGYEKPRILLSKGLFDPILYEGGGTLLEGEMVKDERGAWVFLINDVIGWRGRCFDRAPLPDRLTYAYALLSNHYTPNELIDPCTFHVKRFAEPTREGLTALLTLSQTLPYTNRGIYFWPFFLSYKPKLINFDDKLIKDVVRKVKDNPEFRLTAEPTATASETSPQAASPRTRAAIAVTGPATPPKKVNASPAAAVAGERVLYLKKTENPDIYELYPGEHAPASQKIGVAHVATLASSKMLRAVFKDLTVAVSVPYRCVYNEQFSKWTPLARA